MTGRLHAPSSPRFLRVRFRPRSSTRSLSAFRENDDLILIEGVRRLLVRRVGDDTFRVSDAAAASGSTNLLDSDAAEERDLDGLIDEIAAFAAL
jgi:hypothetical protein